MTCLDCKAEDADCLTGDRDRVCADCLYERVVRQRDALLAEVGRLKAEVRVTHAEDVLPATFSIGDPPLEVDPPEVWLLRFCDLVDIDGTTEEKRLEAFARLYDHVKASRRAVIKAGEK